MVFLNAVANSIDRKIDLEWLDSKDWAYRNEFVAKKLGEVLAFSSISNDTLEKGGTPLQEKIGFESITEIREKNTIHGDELKKLAQENGVLEIMQKKADETIEKIGAMRALYIGDKWENPVEVLEWFGFLEGATIVHWGLVRGAAQTLNHETLLMLAEEAVNAHYENLEKIVSELESTGQSKAI